MIDTNPKPHPRKPEIDDSAFFEFRGLGLVERGGLQGSSTLRFTCFRAHEGSGFWAFCGSLEGLACESPKQTYPRNTAKQVGVTYTDVRGVSNIQKAISL